MLLRVHFGSRSLLIPKVANTPQVIYSSYIEYESKPSIWISQEMKIMRECAAIAHPSREILKLSRASLQAKLIYINSTTMEVNLLTCLLVTW